MRLFASLLLLFTVLLNGCATITLLPDPNQPFKEAVLEGEGPDKVVLIPIRGFIKTGPEKGTLRNTPGVVQETVTRLELAAKDPGVKAVVLAIDSPGGSATGSRVLYEEILRFKGQANNAVVVAAQMEVAASGGYYASIAADRIVAHPTTITGSVGTIFMRPKVDGLLDKIGADVEVTKSGDLKDMGSPFRPTEERESGLFQEIVADMNSGFLQAVSARRNLDVQTMEKVAEARIYTGIQALDIGLVDELGTLRQALTVAKNLAGLPGNATVVAYRRKQPGNDSIYNSYSNALSGGQPLVDFNPLGPAGRLLTMQPGFYHLWLPETD